MIGKESLFLNMAREVCQSWKSRSILWSKAIHLELKDRLSLYNLKFDGEVNQARIFVISESGDSILQMTSLDSMKVVAIPIFTLSEIIPASLEENTFNFSGKLEETLEKIINQEKKRYDSLIAFCGKDSQLGLVVRSELSVRKIGHLDHGDFKMNLFEEIGLVASRNVSFE